MVQTFPEADRAAPPEADFPEADFTPLEAGDNFKFRFIRLMRTCVRLSYQLLRNIRVFLSLVRHACGMTH